MEITARRLPAYAYANYVSQYDNLNGVADRYLEGYFHTDLSKTNDQVINGLIDQVQACIKTLKDEQYSIPEVNAPSGAAQQAEQLGELISALQGAGTSFLQQVYDLTDAPVAAQHTQNNAALIATIPHCGDPSVLSQLKNDVANSPAGKTQGLVLLDMKNFTDATDRSSMTFRVFQADALFNNGEYPVFYKISWFDQSQCELSISMQLPQ